jgi:hypothetical protein
MQVQYAQVAQLLQTAGGLDGCAGRMMLAVRCTCALADVSFHTPFRAACSPVAQREDAVLVA